MVLAFYYAWYDMSTWNPDRLPDLPAQTYVSTDPATIERHVRQAQAAGVDGFVQSWYGPGGGNQTESNLSALLNVAAAHNFRVAVDFEAGSPYFSGPADRVAALQHLLTIHAQQPAYLRIDGRPVVFFWASWLLSVDAWAQIRQQIDPNHDSLWIAEGTSVDYLAVFDGLHLYTVAWSADPVGTLTHWGNQVRARAAALGDYRYWVATVLPGWDDTRIPGRSGSYVRDRAGGAYYQQCWAGAAASNPDLVVITSFNEWMEGTAIEPSVSSGTYYLDLTAQLIASHRAGTVSMPAPAAAPTPTAEGVSGASAVPSVPSYTPGPTATKLPTPTPRPDGAIVHLVEPGDTLYGIASQYGVTLDDLLRLNVLDPDRTLRIGQPVVVAMGEPTPTPTATATAHLPNPPSPTAPMAPVLDAPTELRAPSPSPVVGEAVVLEAPTLEGPTPMPVEPESAAGAGARSAGVAVPSPSAWPCLAVPLGLAALLVLAWARMRRK